MPRNVIEIAAHKLAEHYRLGRHHYVCREIAVSELPALAAAVALKLDGPNMADFLKRLAATPSPMAADRSTSCSAAERI